MALVNQTKREINAKIVFFGPASAGKASNLKHVFGKLKPEFRGTMKSMNVQDSRMLFFDFTPPGDSVQSGFRVRIHVYTLSGKVADPAAWKMVLKGVDGVVFVADAAVDRLDANRESLENLRGYLAGYGQQLSSVPMVIQFNKKDLPDALTPGEMQRVLNPLGVPSFQASSRTGEGVLHTLLSLVKTVVAGLRGGETAEVDALQHIVEAPAGSAPADEAPIAAGLPAPTVSEAEPAAAALSREQAVPAEDLEVLELEEFAPLGSAEVPEPLSVQAADELSLELAGVPQAIGPGLFRLPLTIRAGSRSKSVRLTLSISLEEE
jgi:signal recognition particle receptor subunit beta